MSFNLWQTGIIGFSCSLISSFVFLFLVLWLFKPKIKICPFVVFNNDQFEEDEGTRIYYYFKIVNKSLFSAYDVKLDLFKLVAYPTAPSGMLNKRRIPLTLTQNSVQHLPPWRPKWLRKEASHCYRFRTKDDLKLIAKDKFESWQFQVTCRHGLTGLVKVFQQDFAELEQIKAGKFSYGSKFALL